MENGGETMSIEKLQEKIRKMKNPSVIDFTLSPEQIPGQLLEGEGDFIKAYGKYCLDLMEALKPIVPALRFRFSGFAILGTAGLDLLTYLLNRAAEYGYYVILDGVESLSPDAAKQAAQLILNWPFDGLLVSPYIGTDGLKPYVQMAKKEDKALFVVLRTGNKTASELQDLVTGSRLVYMATADITNHLGESMVGRSGFSRVAGVAAASSADSLRSLRGKYKSMFLLAEGYDYSNANAKNCSLAFDRFGHGAAVCAGSSVTAAWMETGVEEDYVERAVEAAERMKKNLLRYITVL